MASTSPWRANAQSLAVFVGLAGTFLVPAPMVGQQLPCGARPTSATDGVSGPSRLRAADPTAAALLRGGLARSATFRAIVEAIESSDLIVYIEARPARLPGQLQLLPSTPGCRHVRISVRVPGVDTELIAWLGHELWHAVELAGAPDVRDQASLLGLYRRIGEVRLSGETAESAKAQEVWTKVLYEARATGRPK
jgi:hypothetical protein